MLTNKRVHIAVRIASAVPVVIVLGLVSMLYKTFVWEASLRPLVLRERGGDDKTKDGVFMFVTMMKLIVFHALLVPFLQSYRLVVLTHPGRVPEGYVQVMPGPRGILAPGSSHPAAKASSSQSGSAGSKAAAPNGKKNEGQGTGKGGVRRPGSDEPTPPPPPPPGTKGPPERRRRGGGRGRGRGGGRGASTAAAASAPRQQPNGDDDGQPPLSLKTIRFCKKCQAPKPPRAHHCSVCNQCVLKMDHHCPWVANCIGFHNYRHFMLFILYGFCLCFMMTIVWLDGIILGNLPEGSVNGLSLASFMLSISFTIALGLFSVMHLYLTCTGRSSLELRGTQRGRYDMGIADNWQVVFGENWKTWLWPMPVDDNAMELTRGGLCYEPDEHMELLQVLRRAGRTTDDLLTDSYTTRARDWGDLVDSDDSVDEEETAPMLANSV